MLYKQIKIKIKRNWAVTIIIYNIANHKFLKYQVSMGKASKINKAQVKYPFYKLRVPQKKILFKKKKRMLKL
jgi:hypothetical protein